MSQQHEQQEEDDFEDERVLSVDFREEEEEEKSVKRRNHGVDEVVVFGKSSSSSCDDDDDDDDNNINIKTHRWRGKSPLRDKSSLKHFMEILLRWIKEEGEVEHRLNRKQSKKIVLLAGGDGCSGVKLLRVFQLCLGLLRRRRRRKQHLQKTTTTIAMIIEHTKLVPVMKTNGNRQDWLRVRNTNSGGGFDAFEWGCGIIASEKANLGWRAEVKRLAKTFAETSGMTFQEDETALTMVSSSSSHFYRAADEEEDEEEEDTRDYFPSVHLRVREQLLEVSNDISNLFRDNREKYRSDDGNSFVVVESTRERYDDFKRWHYVTSLPTLHGVYLEVVGKADDDNDDDERNLIGYASFHTEQAPPQFENVVDNLNASKVQRFCVVNRLVVNPKFRGKGVKEFLLRAGCDLYHAKGIPCRITTSAYTAKVSLDACKLLTFERFKSRKDTGKERSSGKRKIVVNVPTSTQKCKEADDDNDEKKEREVKRDVLRTLNALTPDSCAKLTPKLRETFDALSENDLTYVSGYVISLARLAPQLRKLLADAVLGTRLENLVRKDAQKEIEKLSTSSSFHLSEEEVSARVRFLNAFVSEMNSEKNAARYLGAKDSALAMTRRDVFTAAKRDMSALRIVEEDSNIFADVKRGQRSGWSYIYIGNPVTRRIDGKNFTFDGETNRFISSSNMLECN
ncbi:unnamed protein product [Bathycoccus prasinos]|jgi:GNAT superfamily N-acetyltransferase|tara:strand:+ start:974 stop:3016 length:2043 start_codon:yes stop_codon:yes gene_type:complete